MSNFTFQAQISMENVERFYNLPKIMFSSNGIAINHCNIEEQEQGGQIVFTLQTEKGPVSLTISFKSWTKLLFNWHYNAARNFQSNDLGRWMFGDKHGGYEYLHVYQRIDRSVGIELWEADMAPVAIIHLPAKLFEAIAQAWLTYLSS